jgi:hypothetical protein
MIAPTPASLFVFDTKTTRYWSRDLVNGAWVWNNHLGPLAGRDNVPAEAPEAPAESK